jgi:hypothetical protein
MTSRARVSRVDTPLWVSRVASREHPLARAGDHLADALHAADEVDDPGAGLLELGAAGQAHDPLLHPDLDALGPVGRVEEEGGDHPFLDREVAELAGTVLRKLLAAENAGDHVGGGRR